MAIYHLHVSKISRAEGRSATAAAAYRAGEKIRDTRTKETHDYTKKKGIESKELVLPGGRKEERAIFWNRVEEHHKRGDAVVAREIEVSLPAELSKFQRKELAVRYARELAERYGVAADVAIHQPSRKGDQRNHHAHIMLSACQVSRDGALGKKAAELDPIHCQRHKIETLVERERPRWAELVNKELERNREKSRVDHRTLKAQGIERAPTQHLGPSATAIERKSGQLSRTTQERDHQEQSLEQARIAREEAERAREQERRQREKEQREKAIQEKAKQLQEQAIKNREEQLAKAREATEKRRLEQELKATPKPPEPARTPPRAMAWRGPTSKPAPQKTVSPLENIAKEPSPIRQDQEQLRQAQEQAEQQERAQEERRAQEAAEKERQEKAAREREEKAAQERAAEQARKESQAREAQRQAEQRAVQEEAERARKESIRAAMLEKGAQLRQKEPEKPPTLHQEPPKQPTPDKEQSRQQTWEEAAPSRQEQQPAPQEKPREKTAAEKLRDFEESLAAARERYLQQKKAEQERTQPNDKNKGRGGPER